MTVSSTTTKVSYSGNGSTTVFAYTFKIFADADLTVIVRTDSTGAEVTKTLTTDYTVSGAGNVSGGNVTFVTAPASGETVVIKRNLALTQSTDYTPNDPFPAASHEDALDRQMFIAQQQEERFGRALVLPETDTASTTIPNSVTRADKFLGFDSSGNVTALSSTGVTPGAVGTGELEDGSVTTAKLADNSVTSAKIVDGTIATADIADDAITAAKFNISGNGTSGQVVQSDGDGSFSYATLAAGFVSGMLMPYAGASAPSGWLLCYGQAISRTTYADLFTAIGTVYGVGDGSTTFNLPDLRGRVVAGQDDMGGSSANRLTDQTGGLNGDTLGDTGGSETHTLTEAQLPSHSHSSVITGVSAVIGDRFQIAGSSSAPRAVTSVSATSGSTSTTGSGDAHNIVQPTIILNYIIKE
jgi:microcystin-dependent protein